MTAYNKSGAAAYYAYKAYEFKQAYDLCQQVKDTPQATDAMLAIATKIAEMVGIGNWRPGWQPLIPPQVSVALSQQQIDLIDQAYAGLKESVYGSLVMQTRLKPYLDQITLVIDDNGLRLDASVLNQTLTDKRQSDPENALADLLDLDRYAGSFLSGTNWEGLARFDSMIETLPQTPAIAALLAEFKVRTLTGGDDTVHLDTDIATKNNRRWRGGECANDVWEMAA